jgi:hypothetical protein
MAKNQYQEAVIPVTEGTAAGKWKLELRVFNDGYAYRYRVPGSGMRRCRNGHRGSRDR